MSNYFHMVEVHESTRRLAIYRVYDDGTRELYTETELPEKPVAMDSAAFERFAQVLGENLLLDSPAARKLLAL